MRALTASLLILGLPALALATRIVFRDVPLSDALRDARIAVLATYVDGTTPHRFDVTERIGREGPQRGTIEVYRVETEMIARARAAYRRTGVQRSPLVSRLDVGTELIAGRSYCVLLQPRHNHYRLAVARGHVSAPCPTIRAHFVQRATSGP